MQKLALAWHWARDHQLSCLLIFQCSLFFLAEEKVWVGLLFRTDNKCSGLEPKLATWSLLQELQKQVCYCLGERGPDQVQTVKDSDCPSGQSDSSFFLWHRQMCAPHTHNVLFFTFLKGSWETSSSQMKSKHFVYLYYYTFISQCFVRNFQPELRSFLVW